MDPEDLSLFALYINEVNLYDDDMILNYCQCITPILNTFRSPALQRVGEIMFNLIQEMQLRRGRHFPEIDEFASAYVHRLSDVPILDMPRFTIIIARLNAVVNTDHFPKGSLKETACL
jgi:hypothetical protein